MATITTLRPSSTSSGVGWSAVTSGTLDQVTSDNNDGTYALWSGDGSPLILGTPADSPPAGERRHQVRLSARGQAGNAWWAVRTSAGALVSGAAGSFDVSPETIVGSWGTGVPPDNATVLYTYVTGQSAGVRIQELYLDVDTRAAPTFTPQILDGSGSPSTAISDTTQPIIRADDIDLDGLSARQYRYWVTSDATGAIEWDTGVTSGPSPNRQTSPLGNGAYTAHLMIWSTLGSNTAYASAEQTLSFTMSVGVIPRPDNPVVTPVTGTPFYQVEACAPYVGDFDSQQGYLEIQRVDCPVGGYLSLPGSTGAYADTPDPGNLTDLQLTVVAGRDDSWFPLAEETLVAQYDTGSNQRGWRLNIQAATGLPSLIWTTDGTAGTSVIALATDRAPIDALGVVRLRALLDVNNAGVWTVTFSAQESDGAPWVQVGDVISGSGTTSVFNASVPVTAGAYLGAGLPTNRWTGRIYSAEVRDGAAGTILADPDFTPWSGGTTTFTDDRGNVWTVHSPASIFSPTNTTSITVLGPLDTGACADWTDFTLPRATAASACEHPGIPCCSYYRARTVGRIDGDLRVSAWSDSFNPAIAPGLIVMWPSTDASIPAGWDRVTDLDSKYLKGIATNTTQPGSTGGAASHTHTVASHTHTVAHTHTVTGNSGAATGTQVSTPNSAGTAEILSTHTHTVPTTGAASNATSGTSSPAIGSDNNDPARLDVIFIESDGTPLGVAASALGFMPDISVSGWTDYANATGRFLKGAVAAGNGGATSASALDAHTHSLGAHTHTGPAHTHSSTSGSAASANTLTTGAAAVLNATGHTHPVSAASTAAAALGSNAAGSSDASAGSGALDPPFKNIRVRQNTSGAPSLPVGLVCAWRGSLGSIPEFWQLSDGTNGTLDMSGHHPKGATSAIGTTGGTLTGHSHTSTTHSDHGTSGHTHTQSLGSAAASTSNVSTTSTVTVSTGTHTHTGPTTNSTTPTVGAASPGTLATTTQEPPYTEVAFVQLMDTPTPPPVPDTFCLDWDSDRHLIRTTGPSGPMWANVGGLFTWDRDRPFTASIGVLGTRFVTSAPPGGRNLHMSAAVESEAELNTLLAVLARPLVLISPSDSDETWAAPVAGTVSVVRIGRIRQVTADFIGTGPQPGPQLADVGA